MQVLIAKLLHFASVQEACGADTPIHTVTGADRRQHAAILGIGVASGTSEGITQFCDEVGITIHSKGISNAVMCQIWTAMIAILLLQYLKNKAKYDWHMSNLVTFIRIHLMSYIDLWTWMNQLVDKAHSPPKCTQI